MPEVMPTEVGYAGNAAGGLKCTLDLGELFSCRRVNKNILTPGSDSPKRKQFFANVLIHRHRIVPASFRVRQTCAHYLKLKRKLRLSAQAVRSPAKRVLVGRDADEKSFRILAPQYSIIHLATHGVLDNRDPLYSHLLLTKTDGDVENDGSLEAREIMNMHLNADLAVLSACDTGNGRISPGEGVIGMSWAFFVAGSRSMVVSHWRVNSASTSQLMKYCYQALVRQQNSVSKAQALKEASVSLLKDRRYRHPFYWAGFVLVGSK